jgi:hypothetical protein
MAAPIAEGAGCDYIRRLVAPAIAFGDQVLGGAAQRLRCEAFHTARGRQTGGRSYPHGQLAVIATAALGVKGLDSKALEHSHWRLAGRKGCPARLNWHLRAPTSESRVGKEPTA